MMNLSYANNIGVRLARWERDSDSERATQKGEHAREESVRVWDIQITDRIYVWCVFSMLDSNNTPSESGAYCKEEFNSYFENRQSTLCFLAGQQAQTAW